MNTTIARLLAAGGLVAIIVGAAVLAWPPIRLAIMINGGWGLATSDPITQLGLGLLVIGLIGWLTGGTALRLSRAKQISRTRQTDNGEGESRAHVGLSANEIYLIIEFIVFALSFVAMAILKANYSNFEQFGLSEQGYFIAFFISCALAGASIIALTITAKKIPDSPGKDN